MKSQLQKWSRLLQDLHEEVKSQKLKIQIVETKSEIDKILSEWHDEEKPTKSEINKTRNKVSDLIYKGLVRYAEHEIIATVIEKISHML